MPSPSSPCPQRLSLPSPLGTDLTCAFPPAAVGDEGHFQTADTGTNGNWKLPDQNGEVLMSLYRGSLFNSSLNKTPLILLCRTIFTLTLTFQPSQVSPCCSVLNHNQKMPASPGFLHFSEVCCHLCDDATHPRTCYLSAEAQKEFGDTKYCFISSALHPHVGRGPLIL